MPSAGDGSGTGVSPVELLFAAAGPVGIETRQAGRLSHYCGRHDCPVKKNLPIFILLGCAALFASGLVELFQLRFDSGDVYPPYSSLRADPLGTMAFYESLEKIPGISARRDFTTTDRLPEAPGTVYLHLASQRHELEWLPPELFREVKGFLARGGRLVIAFFPQTENARDFHFNDEEKTNSVKSISAKAKDAKKSKAEKMTPTPPKKKKKAVAGEPEISLADEWNFHAGFQEMFPQGDSYEPVRVMNRTDLPLPQKLDWHSGMVFTNCDRAWKTIYARGTNAVVMERQFGPGSVVLATDSFLFSNEALAKDRHADLLAWLIGANKNVVFDEAHLGLTETSGVTALMWKYRLHALLAGLLLLAGLFIWKNSTSLVPPRAAEKTESFVAGKDAASGFVNLLRRSLAPRDLLATCFAEWKKSGATGGTVSAARRQAAENIFAAESALPEKQRNALAAYQKISEALKSKSGRWPDGREGAPP